MFEAMVLSSWHQYGGVKYSLASVRTLLCLLVQRELPSEARRKLPTTVATEESVKKISDINRYMMCRSCKSGKSGTPSGGFVNITLTFFQFGMIGKSVIFFKLFKI